MDREILTQAGLSNDEADIYLSLLTNGPQSASRLSTTTKVKRTYVYALCTELVKKGLISRQARERTTIFAPRSPDVLVSLAEANKQRAEAAAAALEGILTNLKNKFQAVDERPLVTTYEGLAGLKKIYEDTLKEGKEIVAMLQTSEVERQLRDWLKTVYVPRRAEAGIKARVILASGKLASEYQSRSKDALRDVREVPASSFPFQHEVSVYGDKIAFINYKKGEPLLGLVIHHAHMATTMRAWFELAWLGATASEIHK